MIREIYSEENKRIVYVHNLTAEDYDTLSERLELNEKKIRDIINEEIFTPRISRSDWDIYKLYYPEIKSDNKEERFSWCEISPLIILRKEDRIVIIDENYYDEFYESSLQYIETNGKSPETSRFLLNLMHRVSQSLYKYVRFLIVEHDEIETVLRDKQSNEKLISLAEV